MLRHLQRVRRLPRSLGLHAVLNHDDPEMTPTEFRALRKRLGLTQAQLGAKLGLHHDRIGQYERGQAPIPRAVEISVHHFAECPVGARKSKIAIDGP